MLNRNLITKPGVDQGICLQIPRQRRQKLVRSASARAAPSNKVVSKDRSHEDWDTNPVKQEALSFN